MAILEKAPDKVQEEALIWLIAFRDVYLEDYINVKKLVPDRVWKWYASQGIKRGNYEIDKRKQITQLLHVEWRKRPECLRRDKKKAKGTVNGRQTSKARSST